MPTYDFKCSHDHVTTRLFPMSSVPDMIDCEDCPLVARRQIGAGGGVLFKGTGFYQTDYKRAKEPPKKEES